MECLTRPFRYLQRCIHIYLCPMKDTHRHTTHTWSLLLPHGYAWTQLCLCKHKVRNHSCSQGPRQTGMTTWLHTSTHTCRRTHSCSQGQRHAPVASGARPPTQTHSRRQSFPCCSLKQSPLAVGQSAHNTHTCLASHIPVAVYCEWGVWCSQGHRSTGTVRDLILLGAPRTLG